MDLQQIIQLQQIGNNISKFRPSFNAFREILPSKRLLEKKGSENLFNLQNSTKLIRNNPAKVERFSVHQYGMDTKKYTPDMYFHKLDKLGLYKTYGKKSSKGVSDNPLKLKFKYTHVDEIFQNYFPKESKKEVGVPSAGLTNPWAFDTEIAFKALRFQEGLKKLTKILQFNCKASGLKQIFTHVIKKVAVFRLRKFIHLAVAKRLNFFLKKQQIHQKAKLARNTIKKLDKIFRRSKSQNLRCSFKLMKSEFLFGELKKIRKMKSLFIAQGIKSIDRFFFQKKRDFGHIFVSFLQCLSEARNLRREVEVRGSLQTINQLLSETQKGFLRKSIKMIRENRDKFRLLDICLRRLVKQKNSDQKLILRRFILWNQYSKIRKAKYKQAESTPASD